MNLIGTIFLFLFISLFSMPAQAQPGRIQNLLFIPKGKEKIYNAKDFQPGDKPFYIYRNCIYNFHLQNGLTVYIKVIDIRNDSIYYTRCLHERNSTSAGLSTDTLALH